MKKRHMKDNEGKRRGEDTKEKDEEQERMNEVK
jgi:hypothetical protein